MFGGTEKSSRAKGLPGRTRRSRSPTRAQRIVDVPQQVAGGEGVEGALGEVELLRASQAELDALGKAGAVDPLARALEHLRRLVDTDDAAAVAPHERARDRAGSRGHVEHARVGADGDVLDEEAPPARVLREGEDRGPTIVVIAERGEEGTRRIVDRTVPVHAPLLRSSCRDYPGAPSAAAAALA